MDETIKLIKELSDASGVSGYEGEIRDVIRRYCAPLGEISQDKIGSLICRKRGGVERPRVVVAGHMDEIGFMVKHISKEGFIKFTALGGWWDHVLLAQRVRIKTSKGDVIGVIGAKPPHVISQEERKRWLRRRRCTLTSGLPLKRK